MSNAPLLVDFAVDEPPARGSISYEKSPSWFRYNSLPPMPWCWNCANGIRTPTHPPPKDEHYDYELQPDGHYKPIPKTEDARRYIEDEARLDMEEEGQCK